MKAKINLAIADDHKMFRETICDKLNHEKDVSVLGSFGDGVSLLAFLKQQSVDIILLDIDMPTMDGYEVLLKILDSNPDQKIIIISFHVDSFHINKFMKSGACAFITKMNSYSDILDAIHSVYENGVFITPDIKDALVNSYLQESRNSHQIKKMRFSERELEIIKLICEDKTAKEIGADLFIEPKTVEGHKSRIREKMGAKSSIGIVVFAIAAGIYAPQSNQGLLKQ
jgi:DNA-binding NarL/FixJ family response regulator